MTVLAKLKEHETWLQEKFEFWHQKLLAKITSSRPEESVAQDASDSLQIELEETKERLRQADICLKAFWPNQLAEQETRLQQKFELWHQELLAKLTSSRQEESVAQ